MAPFKKIQNNYLILNSIFFFNYGLKLYDLHLYKFKFCEMPFHELKLSERLLSQLG